MNSKEASKLKTSDVPDAVASNSINQPIRVNSNDEDSQVSYLGTTFVSDHWGECPLSAEETVPGKNDDGGESLGELGILGKKHGAAEIKQDADLFDYESWGDDSIMSNEISWEKTMRIHLMTKAGAKISF